MARRGTKRNKTCRKGHDYWFVDSSGRNRCLVCYRAYARTWAKKQPVSSKAKLAKKKRVAYNPVKTKIKNEAARKKAGFARKNRLSIYGLTPNDYDEMLKAQDGGCAGCGRKPSARRSLDVDHEHVLGYNKMPPNERKKRVRALLCHRCNRGLGMIPTSDSLRRLADMLDAYSRRRESF